MMVGIGLRHATQTQITVFAILRRKLCFIGTDGAPGIDIVPHALEIIIQNSADELVKAAAVRNTMLVFQIDCIILVTAQEQIAVGVLRADVVR